MDVSQPSAAGAQEQKREPVNGLRVPSYNRRTLKYGFRDWGQDVLSRGC